MNRGLCLRKIIVFFFSAVGLAIDVIVILRKAFAVTSVKQSFDQAWELMIHLKKKDHHIRRLLRFELQHKIDIC